MKVKRTKGSGIFRLRFLVPVAQKFIFLNYLLWGSLFINQDNRRICGVGYMDKSQFNNLSVSDQACLLLDGGDLVATNSYYHYNVLLYSFRNQFMELVYDNHAKQVLLVRVVNDNILQKYLDNIHLDL